MKEFYENIRITTNKEVIVNQSTDSSENEINNQYEFFKNVKLTEDGYLIVSGASQPVDDITITINNTLYKVTTTDENIRVVDQSNNEVGSLNVNGDWEVNIPEFQDVTVDINGTLYATYQSGGSDNIQIKNSNDEQVGSIINDEVIIANSNISINTTSFTDLKAEGSLDINVLDTDSNPVGSKVGSDWVVPAGGGGSSVPYVKQVKSESRLASGGTAESITIDFDNDLNAIEDGDMAVVLCKFVGYATNSISGYTLLLQDGNGEDRVFYKSLTTADTSVTVSLSSDSFNDTDAVVTVLIVSGVNGDIDASSTSTTTIGNTTPWSATDTLFIPVKSRTNSLIPYYIRDNGGKAINGPIVTNRPNNAGLLCGWKTENTQNFLTPTIVATSQGTGDDLYYTIAVK